MATKPTTAPENSAPENAPDIPVVRSPTYRTTYANFLQMRLTPNDIGVTFGVLDELPGVGNVGSLETQVLMPPTVAKQLAIHLTEAVRAYEGKFGIVSTKLPESFNPDEISALKAAARAIAAAGEKS